LYSLLVRWLTALVCAALLNGQTPSAPEALLRQAVELRAAGDAAGALEQLRAALKADPKLAAAHREAGAILLERREFAAAAEAFRQAWLLHPRDREARYNYAMALANAGRKEEGLKELDALRAALPRYALAHFGAGHVRAELGQTEAAERDFRQAVRLDPALFRAHFELGRLRERQGDDAGALAAYRAALERNPGLTAARYRLAALLRKAGDHAAADAELQTVRRLLAARQRGEQAGAAYLKGLDLLAQGDTAGGVAELSRARQLRPDFEEIASALAAAYTRWAVEAEQQGQVDAAVERFRQALALEPDPEMENHTGVLLAQSGRLAEAIRHFRAALALRPGYPSAQRNLEQALRIAGQAGGSPR
jgi:protein O-GlcNAc transferase